MGAVLAFEALFLPKEQKRGFLHNPRAWFSCRSCAPTGILMRHYHGSLLASGASEYDVTKAREEFGRTRLRARKKLRRSLVAAAVHRRQAAVAMAALGGGPVQLVVP